DARIEIVWPHDGASVSEASRANLAAWLFEGGALRLAPCQWNPKVKLWRAVNNGAAQLAGPGVRNGAAYSTEKPQPRAIPTWQFNDVDVSAARDPQTKLYFFLTVEGAPFRSSVWAHAADARTVFPQPDQPTGAASAADLTAPEARIEIVWPHDGLPVSQARRANLTAMVFKPGTLLAAPPDWPGVVRLHRALNNGVLEPLAVGQRRIVESQGVKYAVWDFNDVDVAAATDPANKIYFTLTVDGVPSTTNVWAHAADARTVFPRMDEPAAACQ
ncbi:MAG: hypothetical protein NTZ05_18265, partial [Chloroflexi bacterium]|nr:hypothetical protein [Chloroflexota bacterium]